MWIFYTDTCDRQQYWKHNWTMDISVNAHGKWMVSTNEWQTSQLTSESWLASKKSDLFHFKWLDHFKGTLDQAGFSDNWICNSSVFKYSSIVSDNVLAQTGQQAIICNLELFKLISRIHTLSIADEIPRWMPHWWQVNIGSGTVMAWCHQAASHYLNQCWPRSLSSCGITRPQ